MHRSCKWLVIFPLLLGAAPPPPRPDSAWTPPPVAGGEAWERATDADWVDARLRRMDTGPTFNATLAYPHNGKRVLAYRGTAIRVGEKGEAAVIFDRNQLRLAAAWTGDYLKHSDRRFGLLNTPTPAGSLVFTTPAGPGWADAKGQWASKHPATAPLPPEWGRFNGLFVHGRHVVLAYTVNGVGVLESPWALSLGNETALVRTLEVGPAKRDLRLMLGDLPTNAKVHENEDGGLAIWDQGESLHVLLAVGRGTMAQLNRVGKSQVQLRVPAAEKPRRLRVYHWVGRPASLGTLLIDVAKSSPPRPLASWTKPGAARWKPLVTKGELGKEAGPYTVDTLTIPYDNPHKALFFCTAHDFLPDGRIAVCTCHGDVWLVKHDDKLTKVEWRRFATGLYQPLGLKVVDGKVVVLERGQLTRLHDKDGDGEADWYENLCGDWHTGAGEHSYDTGLETDAAGNFYFFKTGDTHLPHGGCLLRVGKDGKKVEVFATGFRHPIGLGLSPTGVVTGADQEGNWMPATRIDVYQKGGFYGDMRAHHHAKAPTTFDPPLLWLPKEADNSAGGQVWVPHDRFGLPKGQMLHLSYGRCKLYAVLPQTVGDVRQAGAVDLGLFFLSGVRTGRFSPKDGHLYVTGLNGWQTAARRDGCLQRVRYTGKPLHVPTGLSVHAGAIRLSFPHAVDRKLAAEKGRYRIDQWNYRWSADYGSKRWSVRRPGRVGEDLLTVESAEVAADGKSVLLRVKSLVPAMQTRIGYNLRWADGGQLTGAIYSTIHRLAPP